MQGIQEWFNRIDWTLVLAVLFGISEVLAMIPQVRANSVFQAVFNGLKKLTGRGSLLLVLCSLLMGILISPAFALEIGGDQSIDGYFFLGRQADIDKSNDRYTLTTPDDQWYMNAELGYRYKTVRPFLKYEELTKSYQVKSIGVDIGLKELSFGSVFMRIEYDYRKINRVPSRYGIAGIGLKF